MIPSSGEVFLRRPRFGSGPGSLLVRGNGPAGSSAQRALRRRRRAAGRDGGIDRLHRPRHDHFPMVNSLSSCPPPGCRPLATGASVHASTACAWRPAGPSATSPPPDPITDHRPPTAPHHGRREIRGSGASGSSPPPVTSPPLHLTSAARSGSSGPHLLGPRCNVSTCHGPFPREPRPAKRRCISNLIDVPANNAAASRAGNLRVVPGDAANSFLHRSCKGRRVRRRLHHAAHGGALPQIELICSNAWITCRRAETGDVPGSPPPSASSSTARSRATPPPAATPDPRRPSLLPARSRRAASVFRRRTPPTSTPPSSSTRSTPHAPLRRLPEPGRQSAVGVWLRGDFGCFQEATFGNSISGSPQRPTRRQLPRGWRASSGRELHRAERALQERLQRADPDEAVGHHLPVPRNPDARGQTLTSARHDLQHRRTAVHAEGADRKGHQLGSCRLSFVNVAVTAQAACASHRLALRRPQAYENFDWATAEHDPDPPFVLAPATGSTTSACTTTASPAR